MLDEGMDAYGTQLQRGEPGEEDILYTAVANVTNVSGPAIERETIETTVHKPKSAPGAGWRTFIGGLKDGGEVSLDINYTADGHNAIYADFEDGDPRAYRLVLPDPDQTAWELNLIITGFEAEFPFDGKAEGTLTFKVSGKPNLTALGAVAGASVDPSAASLTIGS